MCNFLKPWHVWKLPSPYLIDGVAGYNILVVDSFPSGVSRICPTFMSTVGDLKPF